MMSEGMSHKVPGTVYIFGGWEGKRSVKRMSANIANQLLSNQSTSRSHCVKSRLEPKRSFCRRHEPSLRVNVNGILSIARAWLNDAWKGVISSVMFRNARPSSHPLERDRWIVALLCTTHTRLTRHRKCHRWIGRGKGTRTIVGDCVRGSTTSFAEQREKEIVIVCVQDYQLTNLILLITRVKNVISLCLAEFYIMHFYFAY